jgi:hypothetical protein
VEPTHPPPPTWTLRYLQNKLAEFRNVTLFQQNNKKCGEKSWGNPNYNSTYINLGVTRLLVGKPHTLISVLLNKQKTISPVKKTHPKSNFGCDIIINNLVLSSEHISTYKSI